MITSVVLHMNSNGNMKEAHGLQGTLKFPPYLNLKLKRIQLEKERRTVAAAGPTTFERRRWRLRYEFCSKASTKQASSLMAGQEPGGPSSNKEEIDNDLCHGFTCMLARTQIG